MNERIVKELTAEELKARRFGNFTIDPDGRVGLNASKNIPVYEFPVYGAEGELSFKVARYRVDGNRVIETIS